MISTGQKRCQGRGIANIAAPAPQTSTCSSKAYATTT
jgi:hypothetical protein